MKHFASVLLLLGLALSIPCPVALPQTESVRPSFFLGFDRNDYPGETNLAALHQSFAFAGYWLNNPPGAKTNSWAGKRANLKAAGFGFLILFNGRLYKDLSHNPAALGQVDGKAAVTSACHEGFPSRTTIFPT